MSPCESPPSKPDLLPPSVVERHPDLYFDDGNLVLLTPTRYFVVHQGFLCRHSPVLKDVVETLESSSSLLRLEGLPVVKVQDTSEDMLYFLIALYDGLPEMPFAAESFGIASALLRLSTKYQVHRLRQQLLSELSAAWPSTLSSWDAREEAMLSPNGAYEPRKYTPHPILVINLARSVNAPELLSSAFYDLSRSSISSTAAGYIASETMECHQLAEEDLFHLLKGREDASRFLSTFLAVRLGGRKPSPNCIYTQAGDHPRRSYCQAAFENIFYDMLRDANSLLCYRSCDPLFAIINAEMIHERDDGGILLRPCEYCRAEFRMEVEAARNDFWHSLPEWFGDIQVSAWG